MIALYALWCGLCWVLRGGKFGAICRRFGFEPGTTITRIACAGFMAAPLALVIEWWALALWASVYLATTIGYFSESMGLEKESDFWNLPLWGVTVCAVILLPLLINDPFNSWLALAGVLVLPAYDLNKPLGRRFGTDWTERAEFLTGCVFGAAIYLAT